MQVYAKERQLQSEVEETVESRLPGVEVLAVELGGPERVTVFIDHPGGVDHALCADVTDALRHLLDRYSLEVSSPGLERPLRSASHFAGAVGRKVQIRTTHDVAGRRRFRGEVVAADDHGVALDSGGERVAIPYEAIARGNLIEKG
jgi:ribosome maturation factor RimP